MRNPHLTRFTLAQLEAGQRLAAELFKTLPPQPCPCPHCPGHTTEPEHPHPLNEEDNP